MSGNAGVMGRKQERDVRSKCRLQSLTTHCLYQGFQILPVISTQIMSIAVLWKRWRTFDSLLCLLSKAKFIGYIKYQTYKHKDKYFVKGRILTGEVTLKRNKF
jgi:hypothetical protein